MKTTLLATTFFAIFLLPAGRAQSVQDKSSPEKPSIADQETYLKKLSRKLSNDWPKNRTINVVCHGHSVPAGYFKTPVVETMNAYPHLFHEKLAEKYPHAVINVIVTAIGGEESEQGAARFERDVLTLKPDLITIDYSLNDRRIGLERAKKAWSSMIEKAQAAGIPMLLLTPTPDTRNKWADPQDPLGQHARQVRELAAKYHLGLVDSTKAFIEQTEKGVKIEDLMSQINHPSRQGHELVAKELMKWFP